MIMKRIKLFFIFAFLLALPVAVNAQDLFLKLTDTRTGKTELVKPGATITYQLMDDSTRREGILNNMTVFALEIDGREISLSKIKVLGACSKGRMIAGDVARNVGDGLTFAGEVVAGAGVEMLGVNNGYGWFIVGGTVTVTGGVLWGVGFIAKAVLSPILYTLRDTELSRNLKADVVSKNKELVYPDDIYD